ncbi:MAG: ABC transporter permease [Clostridium sp.]|uniref:putative ABC transporter permease subunit n=1 Tax=Clostridium sp. TaxID=1506 RepID=UPI00302EA9A9
MSKLGILLKTNIINSLGINNIKKARGNGAKNTFVGASFLIGIVAIGALIIFYASAMAVMLKQFGMLDLILIASAAMSVMFAFFTSVYKAQGVLFGSADFENLMSLPIKPGIILTSKMLELLLLNYLFTALIIIPTSIVYFRNVSVSPVFFIFMVISLIFIPLIPIVLASVCAFGLSYISSKTRHKNAILIILSMVFLVGFMAASFKMNDIMNYVMANSSSIADGINKIYPPAFYYADALANFNIASLGKLIIWSSVPFVIFIAIFARSFKSINLRMGETYKKSNYKMTSLKTSSQVISLFKKEMKRYLSSPIYVMNTSVGVILVIIAAGVSLFVGGEGLIKLLVQSSDVDVSMMMPAMMDLIQFMPLIIIALGVGMSCTTGSSISLEGKNLWILKSSPVSAMDIFKGKIGVNLVILIPCIILCIVLFWIGLDLTLINAMFTFAITTLLAVFVSVSGIIINLYFPKLDWKNETQVVKQSLSSMMSMFMGIILVAIVIGICYLSIKYLKITNIYVYLGGITTLLVVLDAISIIILKTKGEKLFNKLSC